MHGAFWKDTDFRGVGAEPLRQSLFTNTGGAVSLARMAESKANNALLLWLGECLCELDTLSDILLHLSNVVSNTIFAE